MVRSMLRWMICMGIGLLLMQAVSAAVRQAMTDNQLDQVFAAGLDIKVDMGLNLAASNPDAVLVAGGNTAALQNVMDRGMALANTASTRNDGTFDPTGAYMPNLQNLTVNNIKISDEAFKNSNSLLNVFALEGDIAVGLNINVIVNPVNSAFNLTQMNMNWGTINYADTFKTLASTPTN